MRLDLPLPFSPVMPTFSPRNRLKVAPENSRRGPRRTAMSVKFSMIRQFAMATGSARLKQAGQFPNLAP